MAFQITGPKYGHFLSPADTIKTFADKTATFAFAELGRAVRYAHVRIYQKAFTSGSGTNPVLYVVEAASVTGFGTDLITAGVGVIDRSDEGAALILCYSPLLALSFWRVRVIFDGSDAGTFDAEISGAG